MLRISYAVCIRVMCPQHCCATHIRVCMLHTLGLDSLDFYGDWDSNGQPLHVWDCTLSVGNFGPVRTGAAVDNLGPAVEPAVDNLEPVHTVHCLILPFSTL